MLRSRRLLSLSAIYLALIGLGMLLVPRHFGVGAVPADASPELMSFLRIFGGPVLGIAVLNWLGRDAEPSSARDAIFLANLVGFGCVALVDVWSVSAGEARPIAKLFLAIHVLFAVAFAAAWRGQRRAGRNEHAGDDALPEPRRS